MRTVERNARIRRAIRLLSYGLYVLTCGAGEQAHAATVTWVTQISLRPRRIAVAIRRDSHMYAVLHETGLFALNVIGADGARMAKSFFKYVPPDPANGAFADHAFERGQATGAPLLLGAVAWLECKVIEEANQGGDHSLFIAEVLSGDVRDPETPPLDLASTGWSYGG
jgi:flavin reductase (DIM6/NTAB) family NADH-FMN oxidoreductase RutF